MTDADLEEAAEMDRQDSLHADTFDAMKADVEALPAMEGVYDYVDRTAVLAIIEEYR